MATQLPPNIDLTAIPSSAALFSSTNHHHNHNHNHNYNHQSPKPTTTTPAIPPPTPSPRHPTPTTTTTAAPPPPPQAAAYTLPQIRAIHHALQSQAADAAGRLRTQVGGSYRELLGTADTIVAMRADMDAVLQVLGGMGARCGRGVVGGKVGGLRGGERLVLGARLCVLGRLLVKSLAGGGKEKDGKVEAARKSLEGVHRGRLTRSIDAVLRTGSDKAMKQGDVLKALAAYSLATSSGARDVLAHFLRVRAEAIAVALELDAEERAARNPKEVLKALGLYTKTLLDVQTLVPQKLTEALVALTQSRLLENASLKEMEGLRLDVYKRWCGDEIQFYTPFIRHDDLDGKQAREMLSAWAKKGAEVLLQGLEKTLESMTEFKAIVELRTSILKLWIAEGGKARGFDPSEMLDQLREAINKHMLRVLETKVSKLRLVGSEVSAALDTWREGITDRHQSLWDLRSFDTGLSNGAAQFTQDVVARLYGRNDAVSKADTSYSSWFHVIDDVAQVVDQLKRQRWDNDVEEIEDEETIEERQKLLSKDDPLALNEHLNRLLVEAFGRLDDQLTTLWGSQQGGPNNGAVAMYFTRLLRGIRARLPDLEAVKGFGLASVPSLHEAIVKAVVVSPLDEFATTALARKTVVGRSLWEGEPALPTSPSPGAFKFLRTLAMVMGDAGGDLWSPAAVDVLKRQLSKQLSAAWLEALGALGGAEEDETNGNAKEEANGDAETEAEESAEGEADQKAEQDLLVQWLMDISYLGLFLGSNDTLRELENTVSRESGLETVAKERLAKASQDYFKRTSLLFGLLA
ncbi:uncharacterized protein B0H64DRAFT_424310 [Chaetomium fimeti]|uniref:Conserved oligomeric Golgi complex subunit 1 n=1 Tax=Chaetomium fimeti TaxID=1854472 RepID=A0AAE0LRX8_9PEZI|nr:hypothetical protein B0H64DRAFT_424310 [Chaetomium fimeti]